MTSGVFGVRNDGGVPKTKVFELKSEGVKKLR